MHATVRPTAAPPLQPFENRRRVRHAAPPARRLAARRPAGNRAGRPLERRQVEPDQRAGAAAQLARTSAAPGKTRLANIFRVARGACRAVLPGGSAGVRIRARRRGAAERRSRRSTAGVLRVAGRRLASSGRRLPAALLLVDARHPGLENDRAAWRVAAGASAGRGAVVATKIDKLARGERIRALKRTRIRV